MITVLAGMPEPCDGLATWDDSCTSSLKEVACLGGRFLLAATRYARRNALITGSRHFTYAAVAHAAIRVARHLTTSASFTPGDRVVLLMPNCPEYLAGLYGTLLAGGVVVPLPVQSDAARLQQVRGQSEAKLVLTREAELCRREDLVDEPTARLPLSSCETSVAEWHTRRSTISRTSLAMLLYTSGSTGRPKGVMLSHRNLLANANSIQRYLPIRTHDRALALLPFCHAFGNSVLQTHLLVGATLIVDGSTIFPNTMVDALERHRITSFSGVPELYHALLSCTDLGRRSLPQLGYMTVAGGALDHDAALRVSALIAPAKFYIMYGQTEATARLAYLPPEQLPHKPNSIGRAIPGVELQVQDDEGRQVSRGTAGELCCRGPNTMLGYWRDRRATAQVMRHGWLRTGDLATADGDGFFYLAGRKNEQLKIKGLKVVPRQVESAIAARMPKCQVVVIPYTVHSTTRLAMFVAPLKGPPPTPSEVHEICRATLARHEVPNRIRIIDRVPLTPSLKVDLASLSLQLENGQPRLPNVALTCPSVVSSANVEQAT